MCYRLLIMGFETCLQILILLLSLEASDSAFVK